MNIFGTSVQTTKLFVLSELGTWDGLPSYEYWLSQADENVVKLANGSDETLHASHNMYCVRRAVGTILAAVATADSLKKLDSKTATQVKQNIDRVLDILVNSQLNRFHDLYTIARENTQNSRERLLVELQKL